MAKKRKNNGYGVTNVPRSVKAVAPYKDVRVTAAAITAGLQNDSKHCAIASAIETLGGTHVSVDRQSIRFTQDGHRYAYMTPPHARDAIQAFDAGREVRPFLLRLRDGIMAPSGWRAEHPTWAGNPAKKREYQNAYNAKRRKRSRAAKKRTTRTVVTKTRMDGFKATSVRAQA